MIDPITQAMLDELSAQRALLGNRAVVMAADKAALAEQLKIAQARVKELEEAAKEAKS